MMTLTHPKIDTRRLAVAAALTFAVAGALSGALIDEQEGVVGALEWILRTLVVLSAAAFVVTGSLAVLRVRRVVRRRAIGWPLAVALWAVFAFAIAMPVGYAVYLSHLPSRAEVRDVDLGAPKQSVSIAGADGVRLRGWYVPSRNGAAVVVLHGTGSNRVGVERESRLLVRHGYGVLALDLRGHGESDGRSTSAPWTLDRDLDGAVRWLDARSDVDPGRIGALGVSMGGETALRAAARLDGLRAVVAEGLMGAPADASDGGTDPASLLGLRVLNTLGGVLVGDSPGASDGELVERVAPRPLLLVSSGRSTEADTNAVLARRGGRSTQLWNVADAAHGDAIGAEPEQYERRVIGFLDRTLAD